MKIVIIGGTGLIGSKLVTRLREHGHQAVPASPDTGVDTLTGENRLLRVELTGRTWEGDGVELRTTNGGVQIRVPDDYSAELETGTVNGGLDLEFPITVQGRLRRTLRTTLGEGGPLIRVMTTNGGVSIERN